MKTKYYKGINTVKLILLLAEKPVIKCKKPIICSICGKKIKKGQLYINGGKANRCHFEVCKKD